MNQQLLQDYLHAYKQNFTRIRQQEQYKWRAVKHFQVKWDSSVDDFAAMLSAALSKTFNLMEASNYFPRRMILKAANTNPGPVREAFLELFDESTDLEERIETFSNRIKTLVSEESLGTNHYQDDRAVLVYLTLRYPDDYYFYKFRMFKSFCERTGHDYQPKIGAFANIEVYFEVCAYLKTIILANETLVQLHREHLAADDYIDSLFNILTQDFVYAVQSYLPGIEAEPSNTETITLPQKINNLETPPASDIAEPVLPRRTEATTYRILRDTKKAAGIKKLYNFRCQICDETIELSDRFYSKAHHIKPLGNPHNGPDHESNIICVCPNHHVLLDYGAIRLDLGTLNILPAHQLNIQFLDYHNTEIYKGS